MFWVDSIVIFIRQDSQESKKPNFLLENSNKTDTFQTWVCDKLINLNLNMVKGVE